MMPSRTDEAYVQVVAELIENHRRLARELKRSRTVLTTRDQAVLRDARQPQQGRAA